MKPEEARGCDAVAPRSEDVVDARSPWPAGDVRHGFTMVQEMFDLLYARITDLERRSTMRGDGLMTRYFARRRSDGVWAVHADGTADTDAIAIASTREEALRIAGLLVGRTPGAVTPAVQSPPRPPAARPFATTTPVQARAFDRLLDVLTRRMDQRPDGERP